MTGIIIVTHGSFGAYLLEACEHIVGEKENIRSISIVHRMSMNDIIESVRKNTEEIMKICDSIIYFVDIPGGTPMNVVLEFAKDIEKAAVICGVNMSMIISAINYRENMDFKALIDKIISDGKRSVCEVKSILLKKKQ